MHIPQIHHTEEGSGLYTVYLDGVAQAPQHASKCDASLHAANIKLANPDSVVTYAQDLLVTTTALTYLEDQASPPPPAPIPLFSDDFNYIADMNDPNVRLAFRPHGWSEVKSMPYATGAKGYLGTVDSIPGYTGPFPSGSPRVLALHALPIDQNGTDFYLQYGAEGANSVPETIPGDVWFQFWIYINRFGNEMSQLDGRNKFIYVCNGGYPCQNAKWLLSLGSFSREPHLVHLDLDGGAFLQFAPNAQIATVISNASAPENMWKLGQQNVDTFIRFNEWTKVKVHYDTSTESGKVEAWLQRLGGTEIKVAEWIDGVTPGFIWRINPEYVGGHSILRMPTVFGPAYYPNPVNTFMYMDQFRIAGSEEALP